MIFTVVIRQNFEDVLDSETDQKIQFDITAKDAESAEKWFDAIKRDNCTEMNLYHYDPNNGVGDWIA